MPTRAQVLGLLKEGHSYAETGRRLGVPAGQAYMIATGRPADAGDGVAGPQNLVDPAVVRSSHEARVAAWVRERAARELTERG